MCGMRTLRIGLVSLEQRRQIRTHEHTCLSSQVHSYDVPMIVSELEETDGEHWIGRCSTPDAEVFASEASHAKQSRVTSSGTLNLFNITVINARSQINSKFVPVFVLQLVERFVRESHTRWRLRKYGLGALCIRIARSSITFARSERNL